MLFEIVCLCGIIISCEIFYILIRDELNKNKVV